MKKSIIVAIGLIAGMSAFAGPGDIGSVAKNKCADEAVASAVTKNYKTFKASTGSCGIKALNLGAHLETYVVCTSDETDSMEYIVVVEKSKYDSKTKKSTPCVVSYVGNLTDAATPNFESEDGLIADAQGCSISDGKNAKISCGK